YEEVRMRSHIAGVPDINLKELIDLKAFRFMGDAASYAYVAMQNAIDHAGLAPEHVSNVRTGLVAGSGGASSVNQVLSVDTARERGVRRVGPYMVPRTMASTVSACLATPFHIKGLNYHIAYACATHAHSLAYTM